MNDWNTPLRPSEYVEAMLVSAILDGDFPPGSVLPGERILASRLGVTRPTLREAIQRLSRDGWLKVSHGKPTEVNDYWVKGGLNVLGKLVEHPAHLPSDFVPQLLEVRLQLAPAYTLAAINRAPLEVAALLADVGSLKDDASAYARFDWMLHQQLTILSGNPIYTLILNGFEVFYQDIALLYFSTPVARSFSIDYYNELRRLALIADAEAAEVLSRRVMSASLDIWRAGQGAGPA